MNLQIDKSKTLEDLISQIKKIRNFDAEYVLSEKIKRINQFFKDENLDSCVIGISGGIDSAVAYKLLVKAAEAKGSPIKKVMALLMPIISNGTSNQIDALGRGLKVIKSVKESKKFEHHVSYLSRVVQDYIYSLDDPDIVTPWSEGQLASIVRMPNLYFHAAILQTRGFKSIVVGTINRDEGAYIGYYGKASDAMVDLQIIADLHKSEVYALANLLDIPESVICAVPAGDVWDARTDEEMIGAPYWFIELYLGCLDSDILPIVTSLINEEFSKQEISLVKKYSKAIQIQHKNNAHKYKVGMPSQFIDVMYRELPYLAWEIN